MKPRHETQGYVICSLSVRLYHTLPQEECDESCMCRLEIPVSRLGLKLKQIAVVYLECVLNLTSLNAYLVHTLLLDSTTSRL
jgi:hypothetical protein